MSPPRDRVWLEQLPAMVVGMMPNDGVDHVLVGSNQLSPMGPVVCVGAAAKPPGGGKTLALVAHIPVDAALDLAGKLLENALEIGSAAGWSAETLAHISAVIAEANDRFAQIQAARATKQ